MKVKRNLLVLFALCFLLVFFSCKGEVEVSTPKATESVLIPEDKTGIVFSNPFKDTTKFEARSVIYYTKYDVDYYQISVWYLDGLASGEEPTSSNVLESLKITKDDSYTAKTLVFDNEGSYSFSCSAYTSDNELIAEDTVKKSLSFATAEFIIFYLVPKIKSQTADVSASITWSGDDITATAHTVRIVRPYDGLDTTLTILQNGNCVYDNTAYLPVAEGYSWDNLKAGKIALSDCVISCMVGKNGNSYSFSLQISISSEARNNNSYYWTDLLTWVRSYSENNTLTSEVLNQGMHDYGLKNKGDYWILLDGKIVYTCKSLGSEGFYFCTTPNSPVTNLYSTADEIKSVYYTIDEYGNILTLGDYVETTCNSCYSYDCYGKNSEYLVGSYLCMDNPDDINVYKTYKNTVYEIEDDVHDSSYVYHYVIFKANRTPYEF